MPASSAATTAPAKCSPSSRPGWARKRSRAPTYSPATSDRHGEDAADLVGEQGGAVDGPAAVVGVGEVDHQYRGSLGDGVQAGAFAEGELELVVDARGCAAGAKGSAGGAVEDQRDRRGVDVEQHHAGLAQPVGGFYPALAVDRGEELVVDRHI